MNDSLRVSVTDGPCIIPVLTTARLVLRPMNLADSAFVLRLLNDPSWLSNIGDRGVRSTADAERYITDRICAQYGSAGYGLYVVQHQASAQAIGTCGLVKREFLPIPDLGFALLPEHVGHGYAREAALAVIAHARESLGIARLHAIVNHNNERSHRLLGRLGFRQQGPYVLPDGIEVCLYTGG